MKVVIFTTRTCPSCHSLEELMRGRGIVFEEKFLEDSDNMVEMLMIGAQTSNQRWTPPILYVDGRFVDAGKEIEWIEGFKE